MGLTSWQDWETRLNAFLQFNDREILYDSGCVTAGMAKTFALAEFEKYRLFINANLGQLA